MYKYMKEYAPTLIDTRITENNNAMFVVVNVPFIYESQNNTNRWKIYGFEKQEALDIITDIIKGTPYEPFARELLNMIRLPSRRKIHKITDDEINKSPNRCFIAEKDLMHLGGIRSCERLYDKSEKVLTEKIPSSYINLRKYFDLSINGIERSVKHTIRLPKTEMGNWNENTWMSFKYRYPTILTDVLLLEMFGEKYLFTPYVETLAKTKTGVHVVPVYRKPNAFYGEVVDADKTTARLKMKWGDETILTGRYPNEDFANAYSDTVCYTDILGRFMGHNAIKENTVPRIEAIGERNVFCIFEKLGCQNAIPYINLGKVAFLNTIENWRTDEKSYHIENGYLCMPYIKNQNKQQKSTEWQINVLTYDERIQWEKHHNETLLILKENETHILVHGDAENTINSMDINDYVNQIRNDAIAGNINNRRLLEGRFRHTHHFYHSGEEVASFHDLNENEKLPYKTITADLTLTIEEMSAQYKKTMKRKKLEELI